VCELVPFNKFRGVAHVGGLQHLCAECSGLYAEVQPVNGKISL
jgi:hypothetical protein